MAQIDTNTGRGIDREMAGWLAGWLDLDLDLDMWIDG